MPLYCKKIKFQKNFVCFCKQVARFCVCILCMGIVVFGLGGCRTPESEEVVWIEDNADNIEEAGTDESEEQENIVTDGPDEQALFVVHICGAVCAPGVYELPQGSRIIDAVEAAGGFASDAAQDARNLAESIADGSMIRIPTFLEAQEESREVTEIYDSGKEELSAAAEQAGLVNINTADAAVLQTLPGIGESRAAAIIAYREQNGAFTCIEDIMKVSGIKQAAFEKLKDRITV